MKNIGGFFILNHVDGNDTFRYQYQWNAQNVATGMYIYEIRTDKFVSVKKMILMK